MNHRRQGHDAAAHYARPACCCAREFRAFGSGGPDAAESAWRARAETLYPIPVGEPFEWWLERAEEVIAELTAEVAARRRRIGRPPETMQHVEWFVAAQVCDRSPTEIGESEDVHPTTVNSAWRKVCERLGVAPVHGPRAV